MIGSGMRIPAFYPILDVTVAARCGAGAVSAAREILDAGAGILQFRHKGFFSREVFLEIETIAKLCEGRAMFVVNDRADVAKLVGAAVHLGQEDLTPRDARVVMGADGKIGYSTHNEMQLRTGLDEPADYLALGPIFGTATKENPDPMVGLAELKRLRALCDRPLVAIGGITRANARSVIEAGADSLAVIGDLFPADGSVGKRAKEWLDLLAHSY